MRISDWSSDVCSSDLIEKARVRFDHAAYWMERLAGTAATIRDQRRRLLWAAGGGLLAGMLLWSFLPGVLLRASPQSWHMPENMASNIIGEPSLWEAGARLMQAHDPDMRLEEHTSELQSLMRYP